MKRLKVNAPRVYRSSITGICAVRPVNTCLRPGRFVRETDWRRIMDVLRIMDRGAQYAAEGKFSGFISYQSAAWVSFIELQAHLATQVKL